MFGPDSTQSHHGYPGERDTERVPYGVYAAVPFVPEAEMKPVPKPAPRERDTGYLAWLHTQPCLLTDEEPCTCGGFLDVVTKRYAIHAHHVVSRGARGSDKGCVPLCATHHAEGHRIGWKTFQARHSVDLKREARECYALYQLEVA